VTPSNGHQRTNSLFEADSHSCTESCINLPASDVQISKHQECIRNRSLISTRVTGDAVMSHGYDVNKKNKTDVGEATRTSQYPISFTPSSDGLNVRRGQSKDWIHQWNLSGGTMETSRKGIQRAHSEKDSQDGGVRSNLKQQRTDLSAGVNDCSRKQRENSRQHLAHQERFVSMRVIGPSDESFSDAVSSGKQREQLNSEVTTTSKVVRLIDLDNGLGVDIKSDDDFNGNVARERREKRERCVHNTTTSLVSNSCVTLSTDTGLLRPERSLSQPLTVVRGPTYNVRSPHLTPDEMYYELLATCFIKRHPVNGVDHCVNGQASGSPSHCFQSMSDTDRLERVLVPTVDRYRSSVYYACIVYGGIRPLMTDLCQRINTEDRPQYEIKVCYLNG